MTITKTFPLTLNTSTSASTVIEVAHFRDILIESGDSVAIYLEAMFCNISLKSFQLMRFPDYDGDENDAERLSKFTESELKSQKIGLRILTRKNNAGNWRERAEVILTNAGRKSYFDLLIPYLAKAQVKLLEYNDSLGVQLIDYGNGLLKENDFIEIECACSVQIEKKNDVEALTARLAALELAIQDRLINLPAGVVLGRNGTTGTVQQIPQSQFATPASIDAKILDLIGGAPGALNTLIELAAALNNDANFASSVANALATKAPLASPVFSGFTTLGDNVAIKVKRITGTTAASQNTYVSLAHGINPSKIISFHTIVNYSLGSFMPPGVTYFLGFQYDSYIDNSVIIVVNSLSNSGAILSKPVSVLIFYIA
ncbi:MULTISPECIES: hypothetical protein [unclassified Microcoleus]|uniref:hypothetical protein n=1 Tax=unclassified Microcoleus TaxID=2642155 RepID=UPI002FD67038